MDLSNRSGCKHKGLFGVQHRIVVGWSFAFKPVIVHTQPTNKQKNLFKQQSAVAQSWGQGPTEKAEQLEMKKLSSSARKGKVTVKPFVA